MTDAIRFTDRRDAGHRLAEELRPHRDDDTLVLAIPRGGVPVADAVARELGTGFGVLVARKLPLPDNPEAGFGAIAEDGSTHLVEGAEEWVSAEDCARIMDEQRGVVDERIRVLRNGAPLPEIVGRTVIVIDDGIAMGSTMTAALRCCRHRRPKALIAAAPVAGPRAVGRLGAIADHVVAVAVPRGFRAVADAYQHWRDLDDQDVLAILSRVNADTGPASPAPPAT